MLKKSFTNQLHSQKWIFWGVLITLSIFLMVACASTRSTKTRKLTRDAQAAIVEARRQYETHPEDLAAARAPLIRFLQTQPSDSVPPTVYEMLGRFWLLDEANENHIQEANEVYAEGAKRFPDNEKLLLNYGVTSQALEQAEKEGK